MCAENSEKTSGDFSTCADLYTQLKLNINSWMAYYITVS